MYTLWSTLFVRLIMYLELTSVFECYNCRSTPSSLLKFWLLKIRCHIRCQNTRMSKSMSRHKFTSSLSEDSISLISHDMYALFSSLWDLLNFHNFAFFSGFREIWSYLPLLFALMTCRNGHETLFTFLLERWGFFLML